MLKICSLTFLEKRSCLVCQNFCMEIGTFCPRISNFVQNLAVVSENWLFCRTNLKMSERKIDQRCDFAIKPTHQNRVISGEAVHDNRFLSNRSGFDVDDKKPRDVALRVGRDASVIPAVARK